MRRATPPSQTHVVLFRFRSSSLWVELSATAGRSPRLRVRHALSRPRGLTTTLVMATRRVPAR